MEGIGSLMIEITRKMTGMAKKIETLADAIEVIEWAQQPSQSGLAFTVAAQANGTLRMQAEGVSVDTVYLELGQWLVFDGVSFSALTDDEFKAAGYVAS